MDLFVTADFPPIEGGISTLSLTLARKLSQLNHSFVLFGPKLPIKNGFDEEENYPIKRVPGYYWGWGRVLPLYLTQRGWIKNNYPRIKMNLAMNFSFGGLWGLYLKNKYNIPYRIFAYGFEFLRFSENVALRPLIRMIYSQADRIYAISSFTRQSLLDFGVDESKIHLMQPAIDPLPYSRDKNSARQNLIPQIGNSPLLLTVGRLIERKGHKTVLEALTFLKKKFPQIHYVIVGRGPMEKELKIQAEKLGLTPNIIFTGFASDEDLLDWYAAADIFVMPAAEIKGSVEGFGLVFLEAGASGVPVIGSRSGGIPEAIRENETGFLASPGDSYQLSTLIAKLLDNNELRLEMGKNGRKWAHELFKNFGADIVNNR